MLFNVHLNIAVAQVHFAFARAAQHHFNARQKLHGLKRLYNVILCAAAQTLYLVRHRAERRQENHRRFAAFPADVLQNGKAVHAGQHHIEQNEAIRAV